MDPDPIPLIITSEEYVHGKTLEDIRSDSRETNLAPYGYAILLVTWLLFSVTINSIFKCWRWIIEPLKLSDQTMDLYIILHDACEIVDNLVVSLWCIYVAVWWWALFSWIGLKLFRQSKGTQT